MSVVSRFCAAALAAWVALAILANLVFADATPVQLVLLYMPSVSNTGTNTASGIAELVMPEGEVRISAANLPELAGDKQYVAWAINSGTNQFQRLGAFNSAPSTGAVHYENVLPNAIPNKQWNLLLVTVEDDADAVRPSNAHSIAGVFPSADNEPLPGLLPNTGGATDEATVVGDRRTIVGADWLLIPGVEALTLVLGASAGYSVGKRRSSHAHGSRIP